MASYTKMELELALEKAGIKKVKKMAFEKALEDNKERQKKITKSLGYMLSGWEDDPKNKL